MPLGTGWLPGGTAPSWTPANSFGRRPRWKSIISIRSHWPPAGGSEARLQRWRSEGIGPKFLNLCGRVLYRQIDIEAYEEACLTTSTKSRGARVGAE